MELDFLERCWPGAWQWKSRDAKHSTAIFCYLSRTGHTYCVFCNIEAILISQMLSARRHSRQGIIIAKCAARLFKDFEPGAPLDDVPVFFHKDCRSKRKNDQMRFTVCPVPDQQLREMRHKKHCFEHEGHIATCQRCQKRFSATEIVQSALNTHMGKTSEMEFQFPECDGMVKRLERIGYELQKDFRWYDRDAHSQALRYFACNALSNVHLVNHATRCFKKGPECYANLPDGVSEKVDIIYNEQFDVWSDAMGMKHRRYMFRFQPKRAVEDVFMNTHNPTITSLLGCNSNVMVGMNGASVIYVTGYNVKSQQKEEREAYEKVSEVLIKKIREQVRVP